MSLLDPDFVLTTGGDRFLFSHLFYRVSGNEIDFQLLININRELYQDILKNRHRDLQWKNVLAGYVL